MRMKGVLTAVLITTLATAAILVAARPKDGSSAVLAMSGVSMQLAADQYYSGCADRFWKQPKTFGLWTGYSPDQSFDAVFGVDAFSRDITLFNALRLPGGGANRLARVGTAALLNAASGSLDYPFTVDQVIALVQSGDADTLEEANLAGCTLDSNGDAPRGPGR